MKTEQSDWKGVRKAAKELAQLPPIPPTPVIRHKPGPKPKDKPLTHQHSNQEQQQINQETYATNASEVLPTQLEIPHHENKVANLLKLSDNELVDKLFPDYTQQGAS
jgi:hypothetical protein